MVSNHWTVKEAEISKMMDDCMILAVIPLTIQIKEF